MLYKAFQYAVHSQLVVLDRVGLWCPWLRELNRWSVAKETWTKPCLTCEVVTQPPLAMPDVMCHRTTILRIGKATEAHLPCQT